MQWLYCGGGGGVQCISSSLKSFNAMIYCDCNVIYLICKNRQKIFRSGLEGSNKQFVHQRPFVPYVPIVQIPEDGHALVDPLPLVDEAGELQAAALLHDHLLVGALDLGRRLWNNHWKVIFLKSCCSKTDFDVDTFKNIESYMYVLAAYRENGGGLKGGGRSYGQCV